MILSCFCLGLSVYWVLFRTFKQKIDVMRNVLLKILLIAVVGLVGCKSKQKVVMEHGNEKVVFDEKTFDPYFKGLGTEPFWNIQIDRKSTRLNSSHVRISYAVFCLK